MQGNVADLTIGDIKKHIAKDSGLAPKDMVLLFNGSVCDKDAVKAEKLKIADKSELMLQRVPSAKLKASEVGYYADVLQDLLTRWQEKRDPSLEKRINKALARLEQELGLSREDNSAVDAKNRALTLIEQTRRALTSTPSTSPCSPAGVDGIHSVVRDLYPVMVLLESDPRTARGWDTEARNALKLVSSAFLRLVRLREKSHSNPSKEDRWAEHILLDHVYNIVKVSVERLGARVAIRSNDDGPVEYHPTLTMEDIEEMEAVHVEAKELLKNDRDIAVYTTLLNELMDLIKDEAQDPGPLRSPVLPSPTVPTLNPSSTPTSPPSIPSPYRDRLIAFYKLHNPDRIANVDDILEQYKGNEEVMFRVLEHKYAPPAVNAVPPAPDGPAIPQAQQGPGSCVLM
jgi:hypothetical protein